MILEMDKNCFFIVKEKVNQQVFYTTIFPFKL